MGSFATQPDAHSQNGIIITTEFNVAGDRAAIVSPCACESPPADPDQLAVSAANAWATEIFPLLQDVMSSHTYISGLIVDGMVDGLIPVSQVYTPILLPGTVVQPVAPQQVCALGTMYQTSSGLFDRMRKGHVYFPASPNTFWDDGGILTDAAYTLYNALLHKMIVDGFSGVDTVVYRRYLCAPYTIVDGHRTRPSDIAIRRVGYYDMRTYPATQRKRLVPHG